MKIKIIITFVIFELVSLIYIILTNEYNGDYLNKNIKTPLDIIVYINLFIISLYILYYLSWELIRKLCSKIKTKSLEIPNLNILFFILSILYFLFYIRTGVGKVGGENIQLTLIDKIIFSPIIISKFNFLIFIYAAGNRNKNKIYYCTLLIFILTEMLRGVTFPLLIIGIIESKFILKRIRKINLAVLLGLMIISINIIYNLKYYIRLDESYQYINIFATLSMFIGRLSLTSNLSYLFENYNSISYMIKSSFTYSSVNEFLEKLTPVPSLFGINEKVLEFGKLVFYYDFNHLGSAIAASVVGIIMILPEQSVEILIILMTSIIYVNIITRFLYDHNQQNCVAFIMTFFTLYQGFWGLLANYIHAVTFYLVMLLILNIIGKKNV